MTRGAAFAALILLVAACAGPAGSPSESSAPSTALPGHDPLAESVKADLADALGMIFVPAGPHHEIGHASDGVELDLIGVPVEQIVLSLPAADRVAAVAAGREYLPHLRELLGGPASAWDWVSDQLACRADAAATCEERLVRAHLSARFTEGDGDGFIVLVVSVEP